MPLPCKAPQLMITVLLAGVVSDKFSSWKVKCSLPLPETTMVYLSIDVECFCVGSFDNQ